MSELLDVPDEYVLEFHQTGSTVICDPPVTNTDIDFVIFTESVADLQDYLLSIDYTVCDMAAYNGKDKYTALRKGKYNYIITEDEITYVRYEAAMLLAKKRNLTVKQARVVLFNKIIEGN